MHVDGVSSPIHNESRKRWMWDAGCVMQLICTRQRKMEAASQHGKQETHLECDLLLTLLLLLMKSDIPPLLIAILAVESHVCCSLIHPSIHIVLL